MSTDPAPTPHPLFAGGGEVGRIMETHDWAATPVGPPHTWPAELRSVVRILLTSRFSMWMGWGPELAFFYNDAYQRDTLRAKHPWALGRPAHEVWAEIWDDIGPRVRRVLDTGEATWDESLLLTLERAGYVEETYHTFSYSPLDGADGRISGMLCVVSETTERVLSERRLRVLSELGEVSAATAPTVEEACRATLGALERGRSDVPFASVYLLDGPDGAAHRAAHFGMLDDARIVPLRLDADSALWPVLQTGEPRVLTGLADRYRGLFLPTGHIDDAIEPDTAVCLPLAGSGTGAPIGVFTAGVSPFRALDHEYRRFLDLVAGQVDTAITDVQAYQAQRRRADELAELDRAKTEFFTGVSHELRTPLTLIAGPADDALSDREHPLAPPHRARLELIRRNSGRLRRLVDTLLDFARLEGGRLTPQLASVDLAGLTRGIAESFAPAVTRAGLGFDVECSPLPSTVAVDVDMWEKIVLNLLSNAVKYTLAGGISITLGPDGDGGVRLAVVDSGIGIPADDVPLLFQRFHRVQGSTGRSREGSGIGLALVAELTALHGGTTDVESVPDHGSTFTVTLPATALTGAPAKRARASAAVERYREEALQWTTSDEVGGPDALAELDPGRTAGDTVLVAEDNGDLRRFLAGLLSPHYRVLVAGDGDTALATALAQRPDLVLTDAMMPGLDGFGLLAALRADPATATTPVVMLSARAGEESAIEGLAAGADDYLVKPFSSADLLARIRSNLQLARVRNHESAWRNALINAMQDGLFVVGEDWAVEEVNDAFEAILGYGADGLPYPAPHPWWPTDPEHAPAVEAAFAAVREHHGGNFVLPARHRDGRLLWIEMMIAAAPPRDGDGGDEALVGTLRDVTGRRRITERDRLLADTGRLLGRPGVLTERLDDLVAAASPVLGDLAVVFLARPDGTYAVAAAHHHDPAVTAAVRAIAPRHPTVDLRGDRAFVLDDLAPDPTVDTGGAVFSGALVVPLVVAGRMLGALVFADTGDPRVHDGTDVDTAEELGRRVALMIETDRLATRERQLHEITAALAAAGSVDEAARVLAAGVVETTGASAVSVTLAGSDGPHTVHQVGDPRRVPSVDDAMWTGVPGWRAGDDAGAALPLAVGERVVGALAVGFGGTRAFDDDERAFLLSLAGDAGLAFERAALADTRRELAETLQRSLLPSALPEHDRVTLAARYLPASSGSNTGGDWYDVLPLDDHHVAIVVGDVVGQGPAAAAVMGQLRSALSAYLLQNHAPAEALTWLGRWSYRLPGARASTVICVVVDTRTGDLRWARAGHPPPLVLGPDGSSRFLEDARGTVLGVAGAPAFVEGSTTLTPGSTVILYTDGLVERRGEIVDDGFARLADAAARHCTDTVERLVPAVLHAALDGAGPADDVALIVARLRPPALVGRGPARPDRLAVVRREVAAWVTAAALPEETGEDLQLALGEALANAVEHAYRDRPPGEYRYRLDQRPDGTVRVEVGDDGSWRPPPEDPGYRGRGLLVIDRLARGLSVEHSDGGTHLTFTVHPAVDAPPPVQAPAQAEPPPPRAGLRVHDGDRLELAGELDVATVPGMRDRALAAVGGAAATVVVDLTAVTHLASAGIGLLLELAEAASHGLRVVVARDGPVGRVLAVTDLRGALGVEHPDGL